MGIYIFSGGRHIQNGYIVDPLNATYVVDGQSIKLTNGGASMEVAPGSAAKITTMVFGTPVGGDLNGDGKEDAAVVLVQNPGGSGTFYYVAAAINRGNATQGTNAISFGDRVAPQTLEINNGKIIMNYADRKPGEPMTVQPSVGVSRYFTVQNGTLLESQAY